MNHRPVIRLIHHLARTGGTLISKCIAVMDGVILLSEINPSGKEYFNPLKQAHGWFGLVSEEEARAAGTGRDWFIDAITLINGRCEERGERLVIRDWSHLDFTGIPFLRQLSYRLRTAELLRERFQVVNVATVRHPLDQLLSLWRLTLLQPHWDEGMVLRGFRHFAEHAVQVGFVRYEDFVHEPDGALRELCLRLQLDFDSSYRERWASYVKITGDVGSRRQTIDRRPRDAVDPHLVARLRQNDDYRMVLDLLGYEHPETA